MRCGDYARGVVSGEIPAGPDARASCQRHLDDIDDPPQLEHWSRPCWFEEWRGEYVANWIETKLRLFKGAYKGQPFKLHPWARFCTVAIFGWMRWSERFQRPVRRFDEATIFTAKGSAKSILAMAWALYMLTKDGEDAAEVFVFASSAQQARIPFRMAKALVMNCEELRDSCTVSGGGDPKHIMHHASDSEMFRMTKGDAKSGWNPSFVIGDEVHEFEDLRTYRSLRSGFKERAAALSVLISNCGDKVNQFEPYEKYRDSIRIAHGRKINPTHFSFVCGLDPKDRPWDSEESWAKANPALFTNGEGMDPIPPLSDIRRDVRDNRGSPAGEAWVERVRFGRWQESAEGLVTRKAWKACESEELSPYAERAVRRAFAGIDLSIVNDLTSAAIVWDMGESENGRLYEAEVASWIPGNFVDKFERKWKVPVRQWIEEGWLRECKGRSRINYADVAAWIAEMQDRHELTAIAYDMYQIRHLEEDLHRIGCEVVHAPQCVIDNLPPGEIPMLPHPQSNQRPSNRPGAIPLSMHNSISHFLAAVLERRLRVRWNPLLRWSVLGSAAKRDKNLNMHLEKDRSQSKIDACIALVEAMGIARAWPVEDEGDFIIDYSRF